MFQSGSFPDTLTSMEDTTQYLNRFLKYRLRNVFKCDMEFDLGRFTIGGAVAYNSYMERIDGYFNLINSGIAHYRKLNERGIWTLDLRLTFRVTKRSSFTVVGKNVTNEFYSLRPGVMEAPRSFTVQYRLNI
jgi:iron complex outermembrane receptor protein